MILHNHCIDTGGKQQPGHTHAMINTKDLLAVLLTAGEIKDRGIHTGKAGFYHT